MTEKEHWGRNSLVQEFWTCGMIVGSQWILSLAPFMSKLGEIGYLGYAGLLAVVLTKHRYTFSKPL